MNKSPNGRSALGTVKSKLPITQDYVTPPLEDRIRVLEKRFKRIESQREWESSLTHRACISLGIYIGSALLLIAFMVPVWYAASFAPVFCYWLYRLAAYLIRDLWEGRKPANRKR